MLTRLMFAAAPVLLFATPALAQESSTPPQRVRSVILYGEQTCPPATDPDEIVVCAKSEDSPYRIPREFRELPDEGPQAQAWGRRVETVEEVNRAVLPGSCSAIGSFGQSGCNRAAIRQWYQERLERRIREDRVP